MVKNQEKDWCVSTWSNLEAPVLLTTADAADPSPVLVWRGAPSPLRPAFWPEPHGTEPDSADQSTACNHSPITPDFTNCSNHVKIHKKKLIACCSVRWQLTWPQMQPERGQTSSCLQLYWGSWSTCEMSWRELWTSRSRYRTIRGSG